MRKVFLSVGLSLLLFNVNAQISDTAGDFTQITEVLFDYIEGTANGQPERLRKAFHGRCSGSSGGGS